MNTSVNNSKVTKDNLMTSDLDDHYESFHLHQTLPFKQAPSVEMESLITEQLLEESPREKQLNTVRQSLSNFKLPQEEVIKVAEVQ